MASFKTVAHEGKAQLREKMSRFIAMAFPVQSAQEAKNLVKKVANDYHDARHVCHAYMIGAQRDDYNSSDNGEPSGTAGKPILGQINSLGLTNVLVTVVRYFGGIKLGTSGLIQAYREVARQALEDAGTMECEEMAAVTVSFPYIATNDVMKVLKAMDLKPVKQTFDKSCVIILNLPLTKTGELTSRLEGIAQCEQAAL